jgi:hypothetical protein
MFRRAIGIANGSILAPENMPPPLLGLVVRDVTFTMIGGIRKMNWAAGNLGGSYD